MNNVYLTILIITVLPVKSILIGQKLLKNTKSKNYSTFWLIFKPCEVPWEIFSLKLCNQKQNLCIVYFDCIFCIDTVEWWWCYDDRDKVIWMAWTHDWIKNLWSANQWTQNPENISNHLQVTSTLLSHLRCIQGQCI